MVYFISNYLEANLEAFNEVKAAIDKKGNLSKSGKKVNKLISCPDGY
jgi:hypothetical protein